MTPETRVYLVDDDPSACQALCRLLDSQDMKVQSFHSAADFLESYDSSLPSCLILDVRMPGMSGLELQARLLERQIDIPIVFISGFADVPTATQALRAGAFDFLQKPVDDRILVERVNLALKKAVQDFEMAASSSEVNRRYNRLTEREREVMDLMIAGETIKQIATQLEISIQTAAKHRSRILDKMRTENDVKLVNLLRRTGFEHHSN